MQSIPRWNNLSELETMYNCAKLRFKGIRFKNMKYVDRVNWHVGWSSYNMNVKLEHHIWYRWISCFCCCMSSKVCPQSHNLKVAWPQSCVLNVVCHHCPIVPLCCIYLEMGYIFNVEFLMSYNPLTRKGIVHCCVHWIISSLSVDRMQRIQRSSSWATYQKKAMSPLLIRPSVTLAPSTPRPNPKSKRR